MEDMDNLKVAVAVLQEQMATVQRAQIELKGDMDEQWTALAADMKTLMAQQNQTNKELSKYRGFWGAIMLVASAIWAFITFMGPSIWASVKAKL